MNNIISMSKELSSYIINIRRELHMYPELSFKEFETSKLIKRELDKLNIPYHSVTETGIVADIIGELPGKTVALRADIDALEIQEEAEIDFKSKVPGVMHACGHDAHTASLLGAAAILSKRKASLKGTVRLIFQPAEELISGAKQMLKEEPILKDVDNIFALHVNPELPCGTICYKEGVSFSIGEGFCIKIKGKSGHGSMPHKAVDALLVACATVLNIQGILTHEIDPNEFAVATIGKLQSGTRLNIIAGEAEMVGTLRCYSEEVRNILRNSISRVVENTAKSYGASAETIFDSYTPGVFNDAFSTNLLRNSASKVVDLENVIEYKPMSGSDDMAFFLKERPGCYAFVGCGNKEKNAIASLHNSKFILDEDSLIVAAALYAQYAEDFLNN